MRILANGNVGIGTTSPNKQLHISSNDPAIQFTDSDAGINSSISLIGDDLFISNDFASAGGNPSIRFVNKGLQSLFIDFLGRIGIGTTSPDEALHIGTGNLKLNETSRIYSNPGSRGSVQISSPNSLSGRPVTFGNNFYYDADDTYKVGNAAIGGSLLQMTASNGNYGTFSFIQKQDPDVGGAQREALTIDANGRLGVGETSPNNLLQVKSSNNTAETIASFGNTSINPGLEITTDGNLAWGFNAVNSRNLTFSTNQQERARITSDGKLGIGTTSPAQTLDVNGTAKVGAPTGSAFIEVGQGATENRFAYIDFIGDTTYTDYGLRLERSNQGPNGYSQLTHRGTGNLALKTEDAADITFITNNNERARIDSLGNCGIGTNNPTQKLDVRGGLSAQYVQIGDTYTGDRTAYVDLVGDDTYTDYGLRLLRSNGGPNTSSFLLHRGTGDLRVQVVESGRVTFYTSNTLRAQINADGTTEFFQPVTIPSGSTITGYQQNFDHIATTTSTGITGNQWVSVLNPGATITLPASPTDGMEVRISVGNFTNTVVARNGAKIMNAAADLTIDVAYKTVTLIYDGLTVGPTPVFGWRII
jgi:hypothetical protein